MVLNWVKNRITLHDAEQEEIDKVFDFLKSEDCGVDFNNIIPMPAELVDTEAGSETNTSWEYYQAKEFGDYTEIDKHFAYPWITAAGIETRDALLDFFLELKPDIYEYGRYLHELDEIYGYHDWYGWSCDHWGVKYNARDARRSGNIIVFETAERGVPRLMLMVSEKFPEVTMDYEFADEYFGYHVARYTFIAGIVMAGYEPEDNTIESRQLARSILGWEPSEDFDDGAA
jgi:hypothetical protein